MTITLNCITTAYRVLLGVLITLSSFGQKPFTFKREFLDENGNKIIIFEYIKENNLVERKDSIVEYKDGRKLETKIYFIGTDTSLIFQYGYDKDKKLVYVRDKKFDINGKVESDVIKWQSPKGKLIKTTTYDRRTGEYQTETPDGKKETNGVCTEFSFRVGGGYNYLHGFYEGRNVGFAAGAYVNLAYQITSRLTLGLDISMNRKKDLQLILTPSFYLADAAVTVGNVNDCDRILTPRIHLLMGIGVDRSKFNGTGYSSKSGETGPTGGIGAQLIIGEKKNITPALQADLLIVKWGDKWNSHARLKAGLLISIRSKIITNSFDDDRF